MTTSIAYQRATLPQVARLGFDDGWQLLSPTFLNLKMPVVIVDHAHIGDPIHFGLEPFGTRDPTTPLPRTLLTIEHLGGFFSLRDHVGGMIIASTCLRHSEPGTLLGAFEVAALLVGSSYDLELTCAALWTMFIGTAEVSAVQAIGQPARSS